MRIHQLLIQWLLLCVVVIEASELEFPSGSDGDRFTNMAIHDGKIYIGAKNYIYVLNADDLNEVHDKVSSCTGECNNINKVLLINEKLNQLITCGTEHGGTCKVRLLNNIKNEEFRSTNVYVLNPSHYLLVATCERRPAVFIATIGTGDVYTAVTHGPGVEKLPDENSYYNYLTKYSLAANEFFTSTEESLRLELGGNVNVENYVVYFKAGFEQDGYVYFVTNQKLKVRNSSYISKLIRVCQNTTTLVSYTDVVIECRKEGLNYNLIQDVSIFEPGEELKASLVTSGKVMVATFAASTHPENPGSQSAVCVFDLENIKSKIMEAKKDFIEAQ